MKDIRDKALAWEVYSRQARNTEAECKAGDLLKKMEKAKGARFAGREENGAPRRSHDTTAEEPPKTLAELGVTKQQSAQWQKLADVPEELFEQALQESREAFHQRHPARHGGGGHPLRPEKPCAKPSNGTRGMAPDRKSLATASKIEALSLR